jgi:hypothetical protein
MNEFFLSKKLKEILLYFSAFSGNEFLQSCEHCQKIVLMSLLFKSPQTNGINKVVNLSSN